MISLNLDHVMFLSTTFIWKVWAKCRYVYDYRCRYNISKAIASIIPKFTFFMFFSNHQNIGGLQVLRLQYNYVCGTILG